MKRKTPWLYPLLLALLTIGGCASVPSIVPQIPLPRADNHSLPVGQDIEQANVLLAAGNKRGAASAYFAAANNYRSPQRERLILQAAELAAVFKDTNLTQRYLSPIDFSRLNQENQARYRFTQAQLASNDRNYSESLRILPQRVNSLPDALGTKILNARMSAAQSSGDKLALVQELVLQEPTLKEDYQVSLNHDRIWNHIQQMPSLQLNEGRNTINHQVLKNWLALGYISKTSKNKSDALSNNLKGWQQRNPNHPGNAKVDGILKNTLTTTVTPYSDAGKPVKQEPAPTSTTKTVTTSKNQIAILLPLTGKLSGIAKTLLQGIQEAHKLSGSSRELKVYNTSTSSIQGLYQTALSKGASTVIGPFDKSKIASLSTNSLSVKTLALNYLQNSSAANNFYQFGLSPDDEAVQVAQYAMNQGQKRVAILTPNSSWGIRLRSAMRKAVIERLGKVATMESYPNNTISYFSTAQTLASHADEIDAILIAASPTQARRLYSALRQQLQNKPIYATSHVFSGLVNAEKDAELEGLVFTETPWVLEMLRKNITAETSFPRLHAMGMDAYRIATSIDTLKSHGSSFNGKTGTIRLSSDRSLHRQLVWARFSKGVPVPHGR